MKFDYTYIDLFGFRFFEPVVILTNTTLFILSQVFFIRVYALKRPYAMHMGYFMLFMGMSTLAGGIGHAVHEQMGKTFFNTILIIMNGFSLLSVYFFFRASYTLLRNGAPASGVLLAFVLFWVLAGFILSVVTRDFLVIKINAAIALVFSLAAHFIDMKRGRKEGNKLVITGLIISFVSILTHSLGISFHEWFNHKDLSHVIMIVSLIVIFRGVQKNAGGLPG